eukprot:10627_1
MLQFNMSLVILSSIFATLVFGNEPVDHYCQDDECCADKCDTSQDVGLWYTDLWKCDADGSYIVIGYESQDKPADCNNLDEFMSIRYNTIIEKNSKCCSQNRRLQENNELKDDFSAMDPMVMASTNNNQIKKCVS